MTGKQLLHFGSVLVSCIWLAGCAGTSGWLNSESSAPPFRNPKLSMQGAADSIAIGQATRADVLAALGPASALRFDSGYEIWVYRAKATEATGAKAELVVLFAPSGIAKKTRIRPTYAGPQE